MFAIFNLSLTEILILAVPGLAILVGVGVVLFVVSRGKSQDRRGEDD